MVVWLATAVVSVWELHGQSRELLAGLPTAWAGGHALWLPTAIILAGAAADAVLGLWLALRPGRKAYGAALLMMLAMTVLATARSVSEGIVRSLATEIAAPRTLTTYGAGRTPAQRPAATSLMISRSL